MCVYILNFEGIDINEGRICQVTFDLIEEIKTHLEDVCERCWLEGSISVSVGDLHEVTGKWFYFLTYK